MKAFAKINQYLMLLGAVNALLLAGVAFIFYDFWNNKLAEVSDLSLKLASLQADAKRATTISRLVKDTKDIRDRLDLYFITKETTTNFIEELDALGARSGIAVNLASLAVVKQGKQANSPSRLRFTIRSEGTFADVLHFHAVLENLPYRLKISAVKIARLDGAGLAGIRKPQWYGETTADLISYIDK